MAAANTPARNKKRQTVGTTRMRTEHLSENGDHTASAEVSQKLCDFYNDRNQLSEVFDVILQATGSMESEPGQFALLHNVFSMAKTMFDNCVDQTSERIGAEFDFDNECKAKEKPSGVNHDCSSPSADVLSLPNELLPQVSVQRLSRDAENSASNVSKNSVAEKCKTQKLSFNKKKPSINRDSSSSTDVSSLSSEFSLKVSMSSDTAKKLVSHESNTTKKSKRQELAPSDITKVKSSDRKACKTVEPTVKNVPLNRDCSSPSANLPSELFLQVSVERPTDAAKNLVSNVSNMAEKSKAQAFSSSKGKKIKKKPSINLDRSSPSTSGSSLTSELSPQVLMQPLSTDAAKNLASNVSNSNMAEKSKAQECSSSKGKKIEKKLSINLDRSSPSLTGELSLQVSMQRPSTDAAKNLASNVSNSNIAEKCNTQELSPNSVAKVSKKPSINLDSSSPFTNVSSLGNEASPQVSAQRMSNDTVKNAASNVSNNNRTKKSKVQKFSSNNVTKVEYSDGKACETAEPAVKDIRLHSKKLDSSVMNGGEQVNLNLLRSSPSAQSSFAWSRGKDGDPPFVYAGQSPQIKLVSLDEEHYYL